MEKPKICPVCFQDYTERQWRKRKVFPSGWVYRHYNFGVSWCSDLDAKKEARSE